jgi:AcrR family transcriptional regulator
MSPRPALPPSLPDRLTPPGTRGRILSAALVSLAERGFHGTSIRVIAEGAGINSATLYSHFASKQHILAELVSIGSHELSARITAALDGVESPAARLHAIIEATTIAHAEHPLLAIVTNREMSALDDVLAGPATAPTVEAARVLREILTQGVTDGSFDIPDPEITARVLEGMVQQIPYWVNPASDQPRRLGLEYVRIANRIVTTEATL